MTRRRPAPASPHSLRAAGDRWLFGYADLVTLLFACFAALYAAQPAPIAAAPPPPVAPVVAPPPPPEIAAVADAPAAADAHIGSAASSVLDLELEEVLIARLQSPARALALDVTADARGVVVSLPETGSFPVGRAELSAAARAALLDLARELRDEPYLIRVEGHTDDVPVRTADFESNWDLSTARATRVVRLLIEDGGLDPQRLSAAGYAEHRPRVANADAPSRARNRRVDIVVLDSLAEDAEALQ